MNHNFQNTCNVKYLPNGELCSVFCVNRGRGHVHLKPCAYNKAMPQCNKQQHKYRYDKTKGMTLVQIHSNVHVTFDHSVQCDAMRHSYYWQSMVFEDPIRGRKRAREFELCNFACPDKSHKEKNQFVYCLLNLWHEPITATDINKQELDRYHMMFDSIKNSVKVVLLDFA